jgi:hypothetical protein
MEQLALESHPDVHKLVKEEIVPTNGKAFSFLFFLEEMLIMYKSGPLFEMSRQYFPLPSIIKNLSKRFLMQLV